MFMNIKYNTDTRVDVTEFFSIINLIYNFIQSLYEFLYIIFYLSSSYNFQLTVKNC